MWVDGRRNMTRLRKEEGIQAGESWGRGRRLKWERRE